MTDQARETDGREPDIEVARVGGPVAVRPCAGCGRPVPQAAGGGRVVRYCQDGGGACERHARERRERGRDGSGLTGQVALAWEMIERLERAADALAGSLAAELSVAGVERRVAEAHAEAARLVAVAQEEREASQRQAEGAWREAAAAQRAAEDLRAALKEAESRRGRAVADRDQMQARLQECEKQTWELSRTVAELQTALAALVNERDAARAEADRARRQIDAYTRDSLAGRGVPAARRPGGDRSTRIEDSPAGLHAVNGFGQAR